MVRIVKEPDIRRRELIEHAQQLFLMKGYERTSINDIVKSVGVAKGTFYYYFDSKTAVLSALVDYLVDQQVAVLQNIVANETLYAIEKWQQVFSVIGNWKVEHKDELLALLRAMRHEDNIRFFYAMRKRALQIVSPEIAKIIQQGVEEGVFETDFADDSAVIVLNILSTFSDAFSDLFLFAEQSPDMADLLRKKVLATQTAVERVLGAPTGSLPIIDDDSLEIWLEGDLIQT